jgi:hypothetical protein
VHALSHPRRVTAKCARAWIGRVVEVSIGRTWYCGSLCHVDLRVSMGRVALTLGSRWVVLRVLLRHFLVVPWLLCTRYEYVLHDDGTRYSRGEGALAGPHVVSLRFAQGAVGLLQGCCCGPLPRPVPKPLYLAFLLLAGMLAGCYIPSHGDA